MLLWGVGTVSKPDHTQQREEHGNKEERFVLMMLSPCFQFPFADANKLSVFNLTQNSKMKPFRNSLTSPGVIMAAPHNPLPIKSVREKNYEVVPARLRYSTRTMTHLYGDVIALLFKWNFYSDDRCNDCMHARGCSRVSSRICSSCIAGTASSPWTGCGRRRSGGGPTLKKIFQ